MVRVCESNIIFFRPSARRPSICPSRCLLLNHWAEFDQTCYMISHHGKGVREQANPSIMLLPTLAKSVRICEGAPSTAHSSIYFIIPSISWKSQQFSDFQFTRQSNATRKRYGCWGEKKKITKKKKKKKKTKKKKNKQTKKKQQQWINYDITWRVSFKPTSDFPSLLCHCNSFCLAYAAQHTTMLSYGNPQ